MCREKLRTAILFSTFSYTTKMQRDDESRRGQKRPTPSTESPPHDDDEHRPDAQPEVLDPLARAQLHNFPATAFQGAKGFTSQPTDFSPKTFISGEFQALSFEQSVEAKFTMGSEFASQSTGQLALTPATFDATSQPSTSYEHEELIFSDTLQHTDNTRTVGLEESVFRTTCPTYHTINVSHSEEFHQAMAQEVPAASGQDSTIISKDTHNLFSALFPSYSRYRHGGFGGIGSEDSQYVPRMRNRLAGLPMPASAGARLSSTALGRARGDSATAHGRETEGEGGNSRRRQSASRLTKSMSWGVQDPRYNI